MSIIDFHCHSALKTYLGSDVEANRSSCWENITLKGQPELIDGYIKNVFDSQASLKQLNKGKVQLAVVSLWPIERPIITGEIKKVNNSIVDLLSLSNFINKISYKLLCGIAYHNKGYFDVFKEIQTHLINSKEINKGYHLLSKQNNIDDNKLNIILAISGVHCLFHDIENYNEKDVLKNIELIKSSNYDYIYFTPAHYSQNPLVNHSYFINKIKHDLFIPKGDGISEPGLKVINSFLDDNDENRILIDIKQMSLKSRQQYYELRNTKYTDVPIIASHAAVTGIPLNKMPVNKIKDCGEMYTLRYKKPPGLMRTKFNPWTINLFDEEIIEIVDSDGIIGITMNEFLLGYKQYFSKPKTEYISKKEFEIYNIKVDKWRHKDFIIFNIKDYIVALFTINTGIKYLCNNILHIIKIAGEKGWGHICIGSGFDGIMKPINACKSAKSYSRLEKKLKKMIVKMAKTNPDVDYFIEDIELRIKAILYHNARNFIEKYYFRH